ncbi:MAG: hypothetical protein C4522_14450 [Desulfobacteraceae bacterium]|nr:MAG: hypothetical protein C4522_14450 [Desulfobacteraceae bacterium]
MTLSYHQKPILICQLYDQPEMLQSEKIIMTHTPLACLNEATGRHFGLIGICFSTRPLSARKGVFELCECLKSNPLTSETPLFVIMEIPHRDIVVEMKRIGVKFLAIFSADSSFDKLEKIVKGMQRGETMDNIRLTLSRLCPFLHYYPIDDQRELITCRAYGNRMVLAGKRLHEVCETDTYLHCEYFLNPRTGS